MLLKISLLAASCLLLNTAHAQLQVDKQLQLTGTNAGDRRITGLAAPAATTDAISVAALQNSTVEYAAATNTANAYAVALSIPPAAYSAGLKVSFRASAANTGAATLNVNGLGAKSLLKYGSQPLAANDLAGGQLVTAMYDGTSFQVLSSLSYATGFTGTLSGAVTGTQGATAIASGAVTTTELADGTITNTDIAAGTITPAKLSPAGATSGQVLTYNGSNVVWSAVGTSNISFNRVVKVANAGNTSYTAAIADGIVGIDMSAGTNFTVNLPANVPAGGILIIKIEKYNNSTLPVLTIVPAGSGKTIDNSPNAAFGNNGGVRDLYSDGNGNWYSW